MQPKQSPVVMVSLIILIMISPALITFAVICQHYFDLMQANSLVQTTSNWSTLQPMSQPISMAAVSLCSESNLTEPHSISTSINEIAKAIMMMTMALFLLVPLRQSYRIYRSALLRHKVAELERLWQQSI